MVSSEKLKALVKSHISRDDGHFYSVAMQMAAHEAKLGHGKLEEELRDLISPRPFQKDGLVEQAACLSYAEICRAVDESIKDAIMRNDTKVQMDVLGCALKERGEIGAKLNRNTPNNAGPNAR